MRIKKILKEDNRMVTAIDGFIFGFKIFVFICLGVSCYYLTQGANPAKENRPTIVPAEVAINTSKLLSKYQIVFSVKPLPDMYLLKIDLEGAPDAEQIATFEYDEITYNFPGPGTYKLTLASAPFVSKEPFIQKLVDIAVTVTNDNTCLFVEAFNQTKVINTVSTTSN